MSAVIKFFVSGALASVVTGSLARFKRSPNVSRDPLVGVVQRAKRRGMGREDILAVLQDFTADAAISGGWSSDRIDAALARDHAAVMHVYGAPGGAA